MEASNEMSDERKELPLAVDGNQNSVMDKSPTLVSSPDFNPATLEALKTLISMNSNEGIEKLSNCDKLTASLEQIRANRNTKLFEKLEVIRQDFSGLNNKIAQMEESITNLKGVINGLVKSLPSDKIATDSGTSN